MKYEIDYEHGKATLYSPVQEDGAINRFGKLASNCFGIRKSIGEITLLKSEPIADLPEPWCNLKGAYEILKHSGGDIIVWNESGEKIKSEWD